VRIRDLVGWPPSCFRSVEMPPRDYRHPNARSLRIMSAMFLPGSTPGGRGEILLLLNCKVSGNPCFAKVKVATSALGERAVQALSTCHGLSLAQAGLRQIPPSRRTKTPAPA
jgi:hypothetical protein